MRKLAVLLLLLLFAAYSLYEKKPYSENHLDGQYVLELVRKTPSGVQIMPLFLFPNPQWGFYMCQTVKKDWKKQIGNKHPEIIIECFKQGDAEI